MRECPAERERNKIANKKEYETRVEDTFIKTQMELNIKWQSCLRSDNTLTVAITLNRNTDIRLHHAGRLPIAEPL